MRSIKKDTNNLGNYTKRRENEPTALQTPQGLRQLLENKGLKINKKLKNTAEMGF